MKKSDLQQYLKKAMLAKDALKTSVLRMLISAITYYEIQKGGTGYEATDEDVLQVMQREAKQRKDSIEQFKNGGRQDLVDKETKELKILEAYLPQQMDEEEIRKIVKDLLIQTGTTQLSDMGKVMAQIMPLVKGKADGSLVSKIVKEELNK